MKNFFSLIKDGFIFLLIIYLVLFILEIVLPGFVSYSFSLNWILYGVIGLGTASSLIPEKTVEENSNNEELLVNDYAWLKITKQQLMRLAFKTVKVPLIVVIIFLSLTGIVLSRWSNQSETKKQIFQTEISELKPISQDELFAIAPFLEENTKLSKMIPSEDKLLNSPIIVLNGNTQIGSASAMAKLLQKKNFNIKQISDADRSDYINAIIRFRLEETEVVNYLTDIVKQIYPAIDRTPSATDSAEIVLILGSLNK